MQTMNSRSLSTVPSIPTPSPYQPTPCPHHSSRLFHTNEDGAGGVLRAGDIVISDDGPRGAGFNTVVTVITFIVSYIAGAIFPLAGKSILHYNADTSPDPAPSTDTYPTYPADPFDHSTDPLAFKRPAWWPASWLLALYGCVIVYAIVVPVALAIQLFVRKCLGLRRSEVYLCTVLAACLPIAGFFMAVGVLVAPHDVGPDFAGLTTAQVLASGCMGYVVIGIPVQVVLFLMWLCLGASEGRYVGGSSDECSCMIVLCCVELCAC
ncbi:hypothetical protein C8T65DRAFT_643016 [Cerioporus squamosus]|nr:hypothetical protein C8T65DRAFT_643016 [Cerioporus squamosus]